MVNAKKADATPSTPKTNSATPKLVLRTYKSSDAEHVDHLFYSTYFSLVPEGVRRKLWSPWTWVIWFAVYSYLLMIVPILLSGMDVPAWVHLVLKLFLTFAWSAVGFATLFVTTDRFETVARVEEARQNDLSDPQVYYLNRSEKEGKDGEKEMKPSELQRPSHFWVLTMEDTPCGMVGLACNAQDIEDKQPVLLPAWKRLGAGICNRYHLPVPAMFKQVPSAEKRIFARAHEPHTATLQRLAVRYDFQDCGLSTLLINRAMTWASEHDIETVYAQTNEMQMAAEQVLEKRHGFKLVKKQKIGWFGTHEATWACDVKTWMEHNKDKTAKTFVKRT
ncbi:uncharacterized protein BYT42DRAFT_552001 [Radiomyces spectabilis]|uniref:uncharacterized protein n=1 Tax=Radiomyces spectabilis TaxID=64574 RepID=UPI00221FA47A|nr:uncharacterized protein BYT42DRAFT_552001 [Radiomyces spectabilis]KAI8393720.1 hypothetical protein BYT42DRAFT_552001 [Radiomyces spectabilis]